MSDIKNDTIKRSDAIKVVNGVAKRKFSVNVIEALKEIDFLIKCLPSADRLQGEWVDQHEDGHGSWVGTCNQCGKENHVDNFCPHCGERMKGTNDDQ